MMDQIVDNPSFTLSEHRDAWEASTGQRVHIKTICKWIHRVDGSRMQVPRLIRRPASPRALGHSPLRRPPVVVEGQDGMSFDL